MTDDPSKARAAALATLQDHLDKVLSRSEWKQVDQALIDDYARVSGDHQWIHVDVERAKDGPYGTTIAHGNLTLSIMGHLPVQEEFLPHYLPGQRMGLNYGFDRVRFPAPLKAGSRIRSVSTLRRVEEKGDMLEVMIEVVAEIENEAKPACVAERLRRLVF